MLRRIAMFALLMLLIAATRALAVDEVHPDLIRRVELGWERVGDAAEYEIEISTTPDFANILRAAKLKDIRYTADLLPGAYFYRVRAFDENGRPGRWTATNQLNLNARPPVLLYPPHETLLRGNLPDTGIPMEWRTSGPGIKYLIEIKQGDEAGNYAQTVVKQEWDGTVFPFYPQEVGRFQWSVQTLGASGAEPGQVWEFEVEGVFPRLGPKDKRITRYVSPWFRNHWWLYSRYGQAQMAWSLVDQELGADSSFNGLTGYLNQTVNWEWHDPVWRLGIPWTELEFQLDRQTVLSESAIFQRYVVRAGGWYDEWLPRWRFSPVLEFGLRNFGIYQPRRVRDAVRANSVRKHFALGPAAEFQLKPFLTLGGQVKVRYEFGGDAGFITKNGDNFDQTQRAGNLLNSMGLEVVGSGTMQLSPRMRVQGRLRYEKGAGEWVPRFQANRLSGDPGEGNSTFSFSNISFDVSVGVRF